MARTIISTNQAPAAVGPYSQGVAYNGLIYTAGQIGLDPTTGKLVEGGIQAQTRQVLTNLQAILHAAGAELGDVLKTTVFCQDLGDFEAMNEVYATFFSANPPARSVAQAVALPLGALVEIEAVAVLEP